ncbi:prefoldin subunit 6 [Aspergillus sclerotialis]|uniref:Prefoldin subunit 6 n=1 Tax=Aspergillus sclerotialis TaxID=2070753 RepID=A0A3A2ZZW8_9EURO|nr:prefoldin subunit 6 [Aspergillus sclerotialis]
MADPQKHLQALSEEYQKVQSDLDGLVEARQKLESQQQENKGVQNEFATLDDDANIFKLIGPVLLKQDKNEAERTVNGRLEFIEKEIKRIESQIKEAEEKGDKKRTEVGNHLMVPKSASNPYSDARLDHPSPNSGPTTSSRCFRIGVNVIAGFKVNYMRIWKHYAFDWKEAFMYPWLRF